MSEIVDSSLKTAVKGTALIFAGMALSLPLSFAAKILIVRSTTKEELGIFSLAVAIVSIMSLVATLGLQEGVPRYISIALGEGRRGEADSIAGSAFRIGLISGLTFSLLLFSFSRMLAMNVFYKPELETPLMVISLSALFLSMSQITGGILRGYNIIRAKVYYLDVGWPLFFMISIGIIVILRMPFMGFFFAHMLSMAMVLVAIGSYGYKKIKLNPFLLGGTRYGKELLKFSVPLFAAGITGLLFDWTDTLMLGRYTAIADVGLYNVSITLARWVLLPFSAFYFVFLPIAGEMYARSKHEELRRAYQVLTKWNFSLTLPIFFVLFFFPEMNITLIFGERFIDAAVPLSLLSIGFLLHIFMGINGVLIIAFGMPNTIMIASTFGAVMNIALNYIFIKKLGYGITGAASATAISYFVLNAIASAILYRRAKIQPFTPGYLRPIAGSVVVGLLIYKIAKSLPLHLWMLPIYFILFVGGYGFSLLLTKSLDREDIAMLEAVSAKTGLELRTARKILSRFVS